MNARKLTFQALRKSKFGYIKNLFQREELSAISANNSRNIYCGTVFSHGRTGEFFFPSKLSHLSYSKLQNADQRRNMFIQTQVTPNPSSVKFIPGVEILSEGTLEFGSARAAMASPLAKALYRIDGVTSVLLGSDFITVSKSDEYDWATLKPEIFAAIMDFFSSGQPVISPVDNQDPSTQVTEDDSEIVAMIKELLETRIRPAVQDDGGDIEFCNYNEETGVVYLKMRGACSGCPSSAVTLKSGIENMLMHYVPEVKAVEQAFDDEELQSEL